MKKTYINPNIEVVELQMTQHLLDGSITVNMGSTPTAASESDARSFDFDDEED